MALNIKNDRVEALVDEVTALTGESKTEAIRRALEERRDRLAATRGLVAERPIERLRRVLAEEIWPSIPESARGRRLGRDEEDALLGYGPDGA